MMLSYDPLRIFFPISVLLGLVFAGKLGFDIVDKNFRPAANTILLGFATLQVLVVGLLADLMVRTARPASSHPSRVTSPKTTSPDPIE